MKGWACDRLSTQAPVAASKGQELTAAEPQGLGLTPHATWERVYYL